MINREKAEKAIKELLEALGENTEREGIKDTPRRAAKYWEELLEGMNYTNREIAERYGKRFIVPSCPLVVKQVKNLFSHCEHHMALMYNMTATIAYIPAEIAEGQYQVIGLSKIPRIAELCAKRFQLQERIADDIAVCISIATESNDVYVNIVADHACVSARGAKNEGATDVTALRGKFISNSVLREEIENKIRSL